MKIKTAVLILIIFIWPQFLWALSGREIMEQNDKLKHSQSAESRLTMKIFKGSRVDDKEFTLYSKEYPNDEDKTLLSFHKPTRIKLLTHTHQGKEDDQWLVLSSGRVKRIASREKGKSFVHSHFYYEDLGTRNIDDYEYRYIGDGPNRGIECFKVESVKKEKKERVYDKAILYVRKSDYYIVRIDFYLNGQLHKYLENYDIQEKDGILTPFRVIMSLADGNSRTELNVLEVKYNTVIEETKFNKEALR